jgi:hypothetical protein
MCNQEQSFQRGVRKFIAKIQMTFPHCADNNLCLHSYLSPSQTELTRKVIEHPSDITIDMFDKSSNNFSSDGSLTHILRPGHFKYDGQGSIRLLPGLYRRCM